jgi:hypothetical protein
MNEDYFVIYKKPKNVINNVNVFGLHDEGWRYNEDFLLMLLFEMMRPWVWGALAPTETKAKKLSSY